MRFNDDRCHLLHNDSPPRHWLDVRVVGRRCNRMGIGAKVRVYKAGSLGQPEALLGDQEISTGYGYASGQPATCHFGLGDETAIDVRITLPGGATIDRPGITADRTLVVEEP
ncbi:MAG: ASPIC/UnbV domain-containing protein [Isosphaeraceae bacterium]|nr:ASPIC/UnbV domain-containing protein [Isosphaeraceae bacterium]